MNLPEIVNQLTDKGFSVDIAQDHCSVTVSLINHKVSRMEIEMALDWKVSIDRMNSTHNGVKVSE